METILKMISDTAEELANVEKIIYKFSSQVNFAFVLGLNIIQDNFRVNVLMFWPL